MKSVSVTIDLTKLDPKRINLRTYTNKEGVEVTCKDYKIDVVEMKEENKKTIKEGDGWKMVKSHFVKNTATKEERAAKTETGFVGDGISFVDTKEAEIDEAYNHSDLPF